MFLTIGEQQRGILTKHGRFVRILQPGRHFISRISGFQTELISAEGVVKCSVPLHILMQDEEFASSVVRFYKKPLTTMVVVRNGVPMLAPEISDGALWNLDGSRSLIYLPCDNPEVPEETVHKYHDVINWKRFVVEAGQEGFLYYDGAFQRKLTPGAYYFWNGPVQAEVRCVNLKQQQLSISGQEILTLDRVSIRLNVAVQYRVIATDFIVENFNEHEEQLYTHAQLLLRRQAANCTLDTLLNDREILAEGFLKGLQEQGTALGVEFLSAGVKDIILPGDVRDIMNRVLIAEKTAQANVITRREEIASTRSLLNTAKLMEENTTLYKLKELEYLERICDKVGNISVSGGDLVGQLKDLLGTRAAK